MNRFQTLTARCIPLAMKDVDTDLIIPAQFLTSVSREGYGQNLFRRLRDTDPKFPFNEPRFQGAEILITDSNFGCGSSREHAVWALLGAGIKAVIGKSFADIFSSNSAKNGLLLITLPPAQVDRLLEEAQSGSFRVTVDLAEQRISLPDGTGVAFDYDPFRKHCLLNGLDDIDYIRSETKAIEEYRLRQAPRRFVSTTGRT